MKEKLFIKRKRLKLAMTKYAENTSVSAEKSRAEIEKILTRYGADQFFYGWDEADKQLKAVVGFRMNNRQVKFFLFMPSKDDCEFTETPTGRERSETQVSTAWEQATRQRWRALALVIKAKLEAVETGITVFEAEFLAHIVLPDGQTAGQFLLPQIEKAYQTKKMPALLPDLRGN